MPVLFCPNSENPVSTETELTRDVRASRTGTLPVNARRFALARKKRSKAKAGEQACVSIRYIGLSRAATSDLRRGVSWCC